MPYCQLLYHLVWATKYRNPSILPEEEGFLQALMRRKAVQLGGKVFALDGMTDHTHVVTSIPPAIAVATFVGKIKGASTTQFHNAGLGRDFLGWEVGYSAFTIDPSRLERYIAYVTNQKRHHTEQTLIPLLERLEETTATVQEPPPMYQIDPFADYQSPIHGAPPVA